MNFNKMYENLEGIAQQYNYPMSRVYTTWDYQVKKTLGKQGRVDDDLAIRTHMRRDFSAVGEQCLNVVDRYFRLEKYKFAKSVADEFDD